MCRYWVNLHLIALNLYSVSINGHSIYHYESFKESKFDVKRVNTVKSKTQ